MQLGQGQTQNHINCARKTLAFGLGIRSKWDLGHGGTTWWGSNPNPVEGIGTRTKLNLGNGGTTWAGSNPNLYQLSNENFAFGPRNKKQMGSLVLLYWMERKPTKFWSKGIETMEIWSSKSTIKLRMISMNIKLGLTATWACRVEWDQKWIHAGQGKI